MTKGAYQTVLDDKSGYDHIIRPQICRRALKEIIVGGLQAVRTPMVPSSGASSLWWTIRPLDWSYGSGLQHTDRKEWDAPSPFHSLPNAWFFRSRPICKTLAILGLIPSFKTRAFSPHSYRACPLSSARAQPTLYNCRSRRSPKAVLVANPDPSGSGLSSPCFAWTAIRGVPTLRKEGYRSNFRLPCDL